MIIFVPQDLLRSNITHDFEVDVQSFGWKCGYLADINSLVGFDNVSDVKPPVVGVPVVVKQRQAHFQTFLSPAINFNSFVQSSQNSLKRDINPLFARVSRVSDSQEFYGVFLVP